MSARSPYRTPTARGANMMQANPQRLTSADGSRWATGRTVRGEAPGGGYRPVQVWALKHRVNGKAVTVRAGVARDEAEAWTASREKPMSTFGAYTEQNYGQRVGLTILEQMGGAGRLAMMVGAKNFTTFLAGVQFNIGRGAKDGINKVVVRLDPDDTYTVTFRKPSRTDPMGKVVAEFSGVYADGLMDLFERTTGFYLTMRPRR